MESSEVGRQEYDPHEEGCRDGDKYVAGIIEVLWQSFGQVTEDCTCEYW